MTKWNVYDASWIILGVTVALVSLVPVFHRTPWQIALSLGEGLATMVTASVILLPALLFYQMQRETGAMDILMHGLARFVPDHDIQTLLLVLGVGPCLEALCGSGFGAIAVLPLLVRLHDNKLKAVQLSLLSQIILPWGSPGLGTTLAANPAGLPVGLLSMRTVMLLFPSTIGLSTATLLLSGGQRALERYWCAALLAGGILILGTCLCCPFFITEVSGVLVGVCVIALLLAWSQLMHASPFPLSYQYVNAFETTPFLLALVPYILLITGIFVSRLSNPPVKPLRFYAWGYKGVPFGGAMGEE